MKRNAIEENGQYQKKMKKISLINVETQRSNAYPSQKRHQLFNEANTIVMTMKL